MPSQNDSVKSGLDSRQKKNLLLKSPYGTRLPKWLITWLQNQEISQSTIIEAALVAHYKLSPPPITSYIVKEKQNIRIKKVD